MVDVDGLLNQDEIDQTIKKLYKKGSNVKETYSGPDYQNLDIYQVNCTYYSALGCNDDAYINVKSYKTKITYTDPVASRTVDFEV